MLYYVALIWNEQDAIRSARASVLRSRVTSAFPNWKGAVDEAGLFVSYVVTREDDPYQAYVLQHGRGVILGLLFERSYVGSGEEGLPSRVRFDERYSGTLAASGGRELIAHYWGQYVAFLRNPEGPECWMLRDPTGGIPCQQMLIDGVYVYFIRLEDAERLRAGAFSVNKHYLIGYMLYKSVCAGETGLNEVVTVLAGERIEHKGDTRSQMFLWNPIEIARDRVIENRHDAVRLMRSTTRACVRAWASQFEGILHELSGGLDSSIVLACMADMSANRRILCRNTYDESAHGDERCYARCVAEHVGCELIEQQVERNYALEMVRSSPRALSPFPCTDNLEDHREDWRLMSARGLTVQFTGEGGDEIFIRTSILPGAVDFAWKYGAHRRLWSIVLQDAVLHRLSFWQVLGLAYHYGLKKVPWTILSMAQGDTCSLISEEVKELARRDASLWHPLFRAAVDLAPSKVGHAYLLTLGAAAGHVPGFPDDMPLGIAPLKSQPLLEAVLRVPVYLLQADGRDRALARHAFASDLPQKILRRRSKCYSSEQLRAVISCNMDLVRELLLDGFLVEQRIVDRSKLEKILCTTLTHGSREIMEVAVYVCVESWARHWGWSRQRFVA